METKKPFDFSLFLILFFLVTKFSFAFQKTKNKVVDQSQKPNIIFILTDDQRWDALGYEGNKLIHTPEMDKLAKEGTYFKKALVTTPICAASRASILTGLTERRHRYNFQTGNIRASYMEKSYPRILKENGYYTGFFGKYGVRYDSLAKQFDVYDSYDRNNAYDDRRGYFYKTIDGDTVHLTRYTGHRALDFIDKMGEVAPDKPFCLSLSFSAPHAHDKAEDQYFWQKTTDPLLQDTTMPAAKLADDKYFDAQPDFVKNGFNRLRWTWRYDTPEKYQHSVKGYYRMISGIDLEIAKIRAELKKKGLYKNTVIILMGDNGYFLGERQLAGKWLLYDNSIRVPMIIYDPRAHKHWDIDQMVLNIDIPPTILDFAGVKAPESWQGKSLVPLVETGKARFERDTVLIEHLWEFENIPPSEGVRTKDWKYFRYVDNKSVEELYNLKKDPQEIDNLAKKPKYREKQEAFRSATDRLAKKYSDSYSDGPSGLSVEFIRQPKNVKILDQTPEYGWVVPEKVITQSGYQILVASSKENINNNIGNVWDSGNVRSSKSSEVEHGGARLQDGNTYYWKVRIWDKDNRTTDYSETKSFQVGQSGKTITTPNIFQIDSIKPVDFEKRTGNIYFMNFGKDAFATMDFTYKAKKTHTLTFHLGEQLDGKKLNRNPAEKSHIRYQKVNVLVKPGQNSYQLKIKADERNTKEGAVQLPDSFPVLMPFRYVEVEGAEGSLSADQFTQLAYHDYWDNDQSSFTSNDSILDQVWDMCKYTIKATSFAGLYVDGDRERIPYEADAYLNQLSHYSTDREYAIARRTIEYFMEHPTWPTEWQQHVALMFYADYMYTGNTELIEKYYEQLKFKTLMYLSREDGLISSSNATVQDMKNLGFTDPKEELKDITDWPPAGWGGDPNVMGERDGFVFKSYNTVVNSFYYENMKILAQFARVLGKDEEGLDFDLRAAKAKKAINEKLFDKNTGAYVDGEGTSHASLHANMMPLAFGIVPEDRQKSVVDFIKSRGMVVSVYGAQYLMEALYKAGAEDYALKLLTSQSDRSWYNMIKSGATMTMEAWDMKYKPNADWNHAWGAVPANIIPRELWGIKPQTPGASIISIKPQLADLKTSEIKVPFSTGTVKASYEKINDRHQHYSFEIPGNVSAELTLKHGPRDNVVLDGEKVDMAFGTIRLGPGKHSVDLVVNSF